MNKVYILFLFLCFLFPCFSQAQPAGTLDSLLSCLTTPLDDTARANTLNLISRQYVNISDLDNALAKAQEAKELAAKINYPKGEASAFQNIGRIQKNKGDYDAALENFFASAEIFERIKDKNGMISCYTNIGNTYRQLGDYEKSIEYQLKSLKISEEIGSEYGVAGCYQGIGNIYLNQKKYEQALSYYFKCLAINEKLNDRRGIANSAHAIGIIYEDQKKFDDALKYYLKSLKIKEELNDKMGIADSYFGIGGIYEQRRDFSNAIKSQEKALSICKSIGDKQGMGIASMNLGHTYGTRKDLNKTVYYYTQTIQLFREIEYKDGLREAYKQFSELYEKEKDFKQSYYYHSLYSDLKDSLLNEESTRLIAEMDIKYDSEKKDKELIRKDVEINKQRSEAERKNFQRNTFITGFILVLALAFFIHRSYNQKKAANIMLEEKNALIEIQKRQVEERNIKITDSITYAKRIQQATLPSENSIKSAFTDSFVLFLPKDIVSGDFYWHSRINLEGLQAQSPGSLSEELIVVGDCTGHGVPGAFMSMIGNTLLNEIVNVKKIHSPPEILSQLNKGVFDLLHQGNSDSETQDDGMDITILKINHRKPELEYAAANHFSYLVTNNQLEKLKGDIYSIGGMLGSSGIQYQSRKIKYKTGSAVYLFTDGYIDQFGGEKGNKYTAMRFETILKDISAMDMSRQKELLVDEFQNWKRENKQIDDILVLGIRL